MEYISKKWVDMNLSLDAMTIKNAKRALKYARKEFEKMRPVLVVTGATVPKMASIFNDLMTDYNQHTVFKKRVDLTMAEDGCVHLNNPITYDYEWFQK